MPGHRRSVVQGRVFVLGEASQDQAGAVLPAHGCPLAAPHSSQGLMSVSMATQL